MTMMHSVDVPGAAGVKAAYHCATLLHNWEEERKTFANAVPAPPPSSPLASTTCVRSGRPSVPTTYTASYVPYTPDAVATAKPPGCFCDEAPRALLLYQGDVAAPVTFQRTLNELCYVPPTQPPYTHDDTLDLPGVSTRQRRTRALAYTMGLASTATAGAAARHGADDAAMSTANVSLVDKEATLLRSMRDGGNATQPSPPPLPVAYTPPVLPPIGRVMQRDCLLSTKQVTIDATGEYARTHLHVYPRTSSVCIGAHMASMNNVMHKTRLRHPDDVYDDNDARVYRKGVSNY